MGEGKIDSAVVSDLTNAMKDYSVSASDTDGAGEQKETGWINDKWTKYYGYFEVIPELNSAINAKATWTIGRGFKADEVTTMLLDTIKGNGIDTFNTILENMIRTYYIGGDAFAEIMRDEEGNLINIKPLNPGTIKIITNKQGVVIRYEQISRGTEANKRFKPDEIFHLARNRVADQVHGVSVIASVENIILARNEAIADYKVVMHRNVYPRMVFHLDTDDTTEIAAFKKKMDEAYKNNENFYVPKDVIVPELLSVAPNATLDPKAWIDQQGNFFYEAVGTPRIIIGGGGEFTEKASSIVYLAFQQGVEEEQLFIEEQTLSQLNLVLELEFPVSLENELLSDEKKDQEPTTVQPNETTAGAGQ
jgi:hypothetical protein